LSPSRLRSSRVDAVEKSGRKMGFASLEIVGIQHSRESPFVFYGFFHWKGCQLLSFMPVSGANFFGRDSLLCMKPPQIFFDRKTPTISILALLLFGPTPPPPLFFPFRSLAIGGKGFLAHTDSAGSRGLSEPFNHENVFFDFFPPYLDFRSFPRPFSHRFLFPLLRNLCKDLLRPDRRVIVALPAPPTDVLESFFALFSPPSLLFNRPRSSGIFLIRGR